MGCAVLFLVCVCILQYTTSLYNFFLLLLLLSSLQHHQNDVTFTDATHCHCWNVRFDKKHDSIARFVCFLLLCLQRKLDLMETFN